MEARAMWSTSRYLTRMPIDDREVLINKFIIVGDQHPGARFEVSDQLDLAIFNISGTISDFIKALNAVHDFVKTEVRHVG